MHKPLQSFKKSQNFSDFASKLSAKWRLQTRPTPAIDTASKTVLDILGDLVAMPTVTGNREANHDALNYIEHFLSERGMHVKRLEWNGIESLVATTRATKKPTLFLMGHVDVVPAPQDSFKLEERDGKYFGRGVLDMKGAIAAYLGAVDELRDSLQDYNFGIMIVTDEESGGFDGAAKLAEAGYVPKVMVAPDGGTNWNMERSAKGLWHITIEATGKSAHGSRPWEGENAIDKLIVAIQDVQALFPHQSPETNTINVGTIRGGTAINQIPASATASIDIRCVNEQEFADIADRVRQLLAHHDVKLTSEGHSSAVANDPANPYLAAYAECTERIIGRPVEWVGSNGLNDTRWFAGQEVAFAVAYPHGGGHHSGEEWIGQESLAQMQALFVAYIRRVAVQ